MQSEDEKYICYQQIVMYEIDERNLQQFLHLHMFTHDIR